MDAVETYRLTVSIDGLDDGHEKVHAARRDLVTDLREQRVGKVEFVRRTDDSTQPSKGWIEDLILSAPADLAAFARILHLWLKRDRNRSIDITSTTDTTGKVTTHISGDNISVETLNEALRKLDQGAAHTDRPKIDKKSGKGS